MSIILPPGLPAACALRQEGVAVFHPASGNVGTEPLRVLLINLMPDKPCTEAQFARMLGASPHHVHLTLAVPDRCEWHHTDADHLKRFYISWREARWRLFDALIVTGAPVETVAFEQVDYWQDIRDILDWAERAALPSLFVCWAAQAALYHRYGVPKHEMDRKRFGVYRHALYGGSALTAGLGGEMLMPVSRYTETRSEDLPEDAGLRIVAASAECGIGLVEDPANRIAYMFNHPEYDATTLAAEYARDVAAGRATDRPENCRLDNQPNAPATWRDAAQRFYTNWLDQAAQVRAIRGVAGQRRSGLPKVSLSIAAAITLFRHVNRAA